MEVTRREFVAAFAVAAVAATLPAKAQAGNFVRITELRLEVPDATPPAKATTVKVVIKRQV